MNRMKALRGILHRLAIGNLIRRRQNRALLKAINRAYAGEPDPAEQKRLIQMRRLHSKNVKGEW